MMAKNRLVRYKRRPCADLQTSKSGLTIRFRFVALASSKVRAWILKPPDCVIPVSSPPPLTAGATPSDKRADALEELQLSASLIEAELDVTDVSRLSPWRRSKQSKQGVGVASALQN